MKLKTTGQLPEEFVKQSLEWLYEHSYPRTLEEYVRCLNLWIESELKTSEAMVYCAEEAKKKNNQQDFNRLANLANRYHRIAELYKIELQRLEQVNLV